MLTRGAQRVKGELWHSKLLWGTNQKIPPQGDFSKGVKVIREDNQSQAREIRLEPAGTCYRKWTSGAQSSLLPWCKQTPVCLIFLEPELS